MLFKFRLALAWGCSVEELEERLPQSELPYWYAFYRLEPFGGDVLDTQFAQICTLFANANRNPKRSRVFRLEDFKLAAPKVKKGKNVKEDFMRFFHQVREASKLQ